MLLCGWCVIDEMVRARLFSVSCSAYCSRGQQMCIIGYLELILGAEDRWLQP